MKPVIFAGHGSPMNAIEDNQYRQGFIEMGKRIGSPKAIVVFSAHWMTKGLKIRTAATNRQINDMYGFPPELYEVKYEPAGYPELAKRIKNSLLFDMIKEDNSWGIDHGVWSVLCNMYPKADVPVVIISTPVNYTPEQLFEVGKRLRGLSDEDILILGSGNVVHNLRILDWQSNDGYDWAINFDNYIRDCIVHNRYEDLIQSVNTPYFKKAAPSVEHFYPVIMTASAGWGRKVGVWNEGCLQGSLSMTSYIFE